jgi:hypothetical protein
MLSDLDNFAALFLKKFMYKSSAHEEWNILKNAISNTYTKGDFEQKATFLN